MLPGCPHYTIFYTIEATATRETLESWLDWKISKFHKVVEVVVGFNAYLFFFLERYSFYAILFVSFSRESFASPLSLSSERESFFAGFQGVAKLASNPREKYRCGPPVGKLFHDTIRSRPQPSFEFLPAKTAHRRILEFLSRLITSPARKRHLPTILTNTLIVIVTRKRDLKDFHFRLFSSYFCVLLAHKKREKFISERVLHPRMEERGWLAVGQENREKPLPLDPCTDLLSCIVLHMDEWTIFRRGWSPLRSPLLFEEGLRIDI